jgi:hypothetical protein
VPAACGLLALYWQPSSALRDERSRWQWSALALAAVTTILLLHSDILRRAQLATDYDWDTAKDRHGWVETAAEADLIIQETATTQNPPLLLIAETAELAAALDYHLPATAETNQPRIQVLESPAFTSQYAFWPRYDEDTDEETKPSPSIGHHALFFTDVTNRLGPPVALTASFASVRPLSIYEIRRHGALLRRLRVFLCEDYVGSSL